MQAEWLVLHQCTIAIGHSHRSGILRGLVKQKLLECAQGDDGEYAPDTEFTLNTSYKRCVARRIICYLLALCSSFLTAARNDRP
jgi:hypothetical protein